MTYSPASAQLTPTFADNFNSYTNGNLAGQGGWTGNDVQVANGIVDGAIDPKTGLISTVQHPITPVTSGVNLQLLLNAFAYSQTITGIHLRSSDSGIGLQSSLTWYMNTDTPGAPRWIFDSTFLSGGTTFSPPTGTGFDQWVTLGIVVDQVNMQLYGVYDFGQGLQKAPAVPITPAEIAQITNVHFLEDYSKPSVYLGANFDNLVVSTTTVQSGGGATVTLTTRDAFGNQEQVGGHTVAFGVATGSTASFINLLDNHNGTYTATFVGGSAGTDTINATIDGQAITSALPTITVIPGPVSLAESVVSVMPATIPVGGTTTITLIAKDSFGNQETGGGLAVAFEVVGTGTGGGPIDQPTDNRNGTYTATLTGTSDGSNMIAATIDGQDITSALPSLTVGIPTSTAVTGSLSNPVYGQAVSFTATITNTDGTGQMPTGIIQFFIDGNPFGNPISVSGSGNTATAVSPPKALDAAHSPHTVSAKYTNSDGNFQGSAGSLTEPITKDSTSTGVTVSAANPVNGQALTFTATVSNTSGTGQTPTGTVQFFIDGSPYGSPVSLNGSGNVAKAVSPAKRSMHARPAHGYRDLQEHRRQLPWQYAHVA